MIHLQNLINSFEGPHFQKNSILLVNFLEIQEKKPVLRKKIGRNPFRKSNFILKNSTCFHVYFSER